MIAHMEGFQNKKIFHFDNVDNGWISHILCVTETLSQLIFIGFIFSH